MTVHGISTITCDACQAARTSISARFSTHIPDGWAEINIDYRDIAEEKTVYEEWHLCPDCTGKLVSSIVTTRQEAAP